MAALWHKLGPRGHVCHDRSSGKHVTVLAGVIKRPPHRHPQAEMGTGWCLFNFVAGLPPHGCKCHPYLDSKLAA